MSLTSYGNWAVTLNRAGYFGMYSFGGIYEFNPQHAVQLSTGFYGSGGASYGQINSSYTYSRWQIPWENRIWIPVQVGAFVVYTMDEDKYFTNSPSQYPLTNYYDGTAYRFGIEFGNALIFSSTRLELAYRIRIIDTGVVAIYNNAHRDLQYYVSSGLELHYRF